MKHLRGWFLSLLVFITIACITISPVAALNNGLAKTPPMGWMTWQRFRCTTNCADFPQECISEALVKRTVDTIVSGGYKDAGYEFVVIDDCWLEMERDPETKRLVPDRHRFPNGMKAVGDYIHAKGLKFGLYEDYGTKTCAGYPGVVGHMELDAQTFADWGVDYVKLDGCYAEENTYEEGYIKFGEYLNKTQRPMVYSCSWPAYTDINTTDFKKIAEHCNLWRNWDDIDDSYSSMRVIADHFGDYQDTYNTAEVGAWNDPDMLLIGNFGLSIEQSRVQMAIWSVLAAPLLMSADMDTIRPEFKEILLNREAIRVNQDKLGIPGRRILFDKKRDQQVWVRFLEGDAVALVLVNHRTDGMPQLIRFNPSTMGVKRQSRVINVFEPQIKFPTYQPGDNSTMRVRINISGCVFLRFDPTE